MVNPNNILKKKAYLIIIAAFLIGIITGSLLMNLVVAKPTFIKNAGDEFRAPRRSIAT